MSAPLNILIATEQAHEAKEVTLSLRAFFPDSRIEVVYSADEVVQWAAKCAWQTILADVDLFRQSGLATLTELKRQAPMATLIIQADCNDMTLGMEVLRFGADFYISKKSPAFLIELPFVLRTLLKNQDLNSQLNAANDQVRRLEEHVSRTQTERQSLVEQLDQVRQQHAQLQGRLQAQEVELSQTKEKKQLLLDQWERIRQAHTKMEEELQLVTEQWSQERGENQAYREQLERLRHERDELQERLFQIDREKQALLTQLGQMRRTGTLLEDGLQRHDAESSHGRIENQTDREQLERISQERDQLREGLSQIMLEKQSLLTQLEQMRQRLTPSQEQIQRLEEQLSQEHRQQQTYSEQIEALRHERAQALDELANIQEEKQYLLHQVENESQEHAQTLEQLAQLQGERQSLVEQLQGMSRTRQQMEERIKRLEERLVQEQREKLR